MARTAFNPSTMLQVFRGSKLPLDVFAKNSGRTCCGSGFAMSYDRLADVVHGPNSHAHLAPTSYNDKYVVPQGPAGGTLENDRNEIVSFINAVGVGAKIGVICIPNYAYITDVAVHIAASEPGLTFNLKTRNGLALPSKKVITVNTTRNENEVCVLDRTEVTSKKDITVNTTRNDSEVTEVPDSEDPVDESAFTNFGALDGNVFVDIFGRDGDGVFTAEADEIQLEVASMPVNKKVAGTFNITVSVNYTTCMRAERE